MSPLIASSADFLRTCQGSTFPGLLGVVNEYVKTLDVEYAKKKALRRYLNLIKRRANGMSFLQDLTRNV